MSRILIGYDIHENRRRRQALRLLRSLTACYQNSFFDCELTPQQLVEVYEILTSRLEPEEDGLIFAWVSHGETSALGQRWTLGGQSLFLVN